MYRFLLLSADSYFITSQANTISASDNVAAAAMSENDNSTANIVSPPANAASRAIDSRSESFRNCSAEALNSASLEI